MPGTSQSGLSKIKIKTRRGPHEIVIFEAPWARADKGEDLEITLAEEPM